MATGAKRSVVLGKLTQNGTTRKVPVNGNGTNGTANGTSSNGGMNGTAHNGAGTASHKLKTTRVPKVTRQAAPTKAKAAAR